MVVVGGGGQGTSERGLKNVVLKKELTPVLVMPKKGGPCR